MYGETLRQHLVESTYQLLYYTLIYIVTRMLVATMEMSIVTQILKICREQASNCKLASSLGALKMAHLQRLLHPINTTCNWYADRYHSSFCTHVLKQVSNSMWQQQASLVQSCTRWQIHDALQPWQPWCMHMIVHVYTWCATQSPCCWGKRSRLPVVWLLLLLPSCSRCLCSATQEKYEHRRTLQTEGDILHDVGTVSNNMAWFWFCHQDITDDKAHSWLCHLVPVWGICHQLKVCCGFCRQAGCGSCNAQAQRTWNDPLSLKVPHRSVVHILPSHLRLV